MKKLIKNITIKLMIVTVLVTSCSEDFLNEPAPTNQAPPEVIYSSREGADAFISGIMRRLRGQFTATDAGGLNSILFARTMKGNDVIQANNWFTFDYANDNREPTYRRTNFSWEFPYYVIAQLNNLIEGVSSSLTITDEDKAEVIGQARALRGYFYFQLALEFSEAYSLNPNFPAPPIYRTFTSEGGPMTDLTEMYTLIIEDLLFAVANAPDQGQDKSYINKNVANAFLAQVYQTMEMWPEAEDAAKAAYDGFELAPDLYNDGFSDLSNPEWIWGLPQYDDQSQYYFTAPHAFTEHFVLSYAATFFNNEFVNTFTETDVRNTFIAGNYGGSTASWFYWISTKFKFQFDSDVPIIRMPEMMLIEAEALFHQNLEAEAHNVLYELQLNRDPNAVKSSNTGQDLLEEILLERRKELYAEIGVEWFDAKRLQRGITRTGNHRIGAAANLQPNDKKFYLKVPQAEIDANPNIDDSVNADR